MPSDASLGNDTAQQTQLFLLGWRTVKRHPGGNLIWITRLHDHTAMVTAMLNGKMYYFK